MAYQSIFNAQGHIDLGQITSGFQPGQYAKINAQIAARQPVNPSQINDVPSLRSALKSGQINQNQFANRYNTMVNGPSPKAYSVGNTVSALGGALNKVFVQPVKAAGVDTLHQSENLGKSLLAKPATQQQRQSIMQNQSKAQSNPTYLQATRGMNPKNNSATGVIQAQRLAANGTNSKQIRAFLQQDAAKLNAKTQSGINALGVAAGLDVGGEGGIIGKVGNLKQTFIDGPQKLLNDVKTSQLVKAGEKANTPTKIPVQDLNNGPSTVPVRTPVHAGIRQESSTTRIPVRTPIKAGIKDISTTTKIGVRTPVRMSDQQFTQEFNKLSKSYDTGTKQLEGVSEHLSPTAIKTAQAKIDALHQNKLNDLVDRYNNPKLSAPTKPKTLASAVTNAKNTGGRDINAPKTLSSSVSKAEKNYGGNIPVKATRTPRTAPMADEVAGGNSGSAVINPPSAFDKYQQPETTTPVEAPQAPTEPKVAQSTNPAPKTAETAPKEPTTQTTKPTPTSGEPRIAGSALKSEARAVQKNLADHFPDKATYEGTSHIQDAEKAVKLAHENPQEAKAIAMGQKDAKGSYAVAVRRAVERKAQAEGDTETIRQLGTSPVHTRTSEAAQTLSSEAYNRDPESAVDNIKAVSDARAQARTRSLGKNPEAKVNAVAKDIASEEKPVKRQEWSDFIKGLQC